MNNPRSRGGGADVKQRAPQGDHVVAAAPCFAMNDPRSRGGGTDVKQIVGHGLRVLPKRLRLLELVESGCNLAQPRAS